MLKSICILAVLFCGCKALKKPVATSELLAFQASWCGPCHKMNPVLKSLEKRGIQVTRIDIDKNPEMAAKFKIIKVPTFVVIKAGKEVARRVGVCTEKVLILALGQEL